MNSATWRRWMRWGLIALPGSTLLGTSCAEDIRLSLVSAGLDFIEGSAGTILEALFPVEDFVGGD